jgi:SAM-dependent methyltransferase
MPASRLPPRKKSSLPGASPTHPRYPQFTAEFRTFRTLSRKSGLPRFEVKWSDRYPCLDDRTATTGFDRHYVYHCAWAARILAATQPKYHVDFSSSLYFCTMLSAFLPVRFFDYRPARLHLDNLTSAHADLCRLPFGDRSEYSLSCMHVAEHIGLGRYGDPLDPDADLIAMRELQRILAPGGNLLFVVPTGKPVVRYNAHRIYSPAQIRKAFSELTLKEFALIPDDRDPRGLIRNASTALGARQTYGCGCYWFQRPKK